MTVASAGDALVTTTGTGSPLADFTSSSSVAGLAPIGVGPTSCSVSLRSSV